VFGVMNLNIGVVLKLESAGPKNAAIHVVLVKIQRFVILMEMVNGVLKMDNGVVFIHLLKNMSVGLKNMDIHVVKLKM